MRAQHEERKPYHNQGNLHHPRWLGSRLRHVHTFCVFQLNRLGFLATLAHAEHGIEDRTYKQHCPLPAVEHAVEGKEQEQERDPNHDGNIKPDQLLRDHERRDHGG